MAEQAKKAAPKRNTTARKTTARKTTAAKRKPTVRKVSAKRKPASKKPVTLQSRVTEASRNAFLAGLGFYGMAFDQVQEQVKTVENELGVRRKKADKLYSEMVKRGEKVEKLALNAIDDIDMPKIDVPTLDREAIEAQLEKAKARFGELKETVGFKAAA